MMEKVVLLVEDSEDDIKLTQMAFKENNIANKMVVLNDGEEAVEYLFCQGKYRERDINDQPTIILLDIKLPKLSGLEVLKKIRADNRTKYIPTVMLTSSTEEEDMIEGYKGGCNSYVCKPVEYEQFSQAVKQLELYWVLNNRTPNKRIEEE
ncbi:MAG: response regulator [Candidatus Omnitrophica bacterium]|nr:response regulator [Candidatus Omnitrophota bacterium]